MDFILPAPGATLSEAVAEYAATTGPQRSDVTVDLSFPRFKAQNEIDMKQVLQGAGVERIFSGENADDFILFNQGCFVTKALQKVTIEVDEQGTEAAATLFEMEATANPDTPAAKRVEMVLDRPFVYAIRETSTSTPLFIGYLGSLR